jgi:hypothetical protein
VTGDLTARRADGETRTPDPFITSRPLIGVFGLVEPFPASKMSRNDLIFALFGT